MSYSTYIIYSKTIDSYYVGMTSNLDERIRKHNGKHKGFTSRAQDWMYVYTVDFGVKTDALKREKEIKGWKSKVRIIQFLKEIDL